jgi:hypothetical protein
LGALIKPIHLFIAKTNLPQTEGSILRDLRRVAENWNGEVYFKVGQQLEEKEGFFRGENEFEGYCYFFNRKREIVHGPKNQNEIPDVFEWCTSIPTLVPCQKESCTNELGLNFEIFYLEEETKRIYLRYEPPYPIISPESEGHLKPTSKNSLCVSLKWPEFPFLPTTLEALYFHTILGQILYEAGLIQKENVPGKRQFNPQTHASVTKDFNRLQTHFSRLVQRAIRSGEYFKEEKEKVECWQVLTWFGFFVLDTYLKLWECSWLRFCEECGARIDEPRRNQVRHNKEQNLLCYSCQQRRRQRRRRAGIEIPRY